MAAENESGFMIDEVFYEMPALDTFNMDEAQILYDNCGLTIEDFAPAEDAVQNEDGSYELDDEQKRKLKNPGFMRSVMHIAYRRGNPKMSEAKIKELIGKVNLIEALQHLADAEDGDALPPVLTTTPDESSPSSTPESSESSGNGSETSSDGQVVPLTPTTTTGSGTSSTPSQTSSVA